jgi:formylglycine-generating enzyme required for sulfatase activity
LLNHLPGQAVERNEQHDLWPAAVTFQEMITGRRPFETPGQISQAAPHPLPPSFPQIWHDLLKRAFAKDPAQRFQSAEEMSEAVNEAFYGCMADTIPPPRVWPSSFVNASGIEFVRVGAGAFMMGSEYSPDEQPTHEVRIPYQFYIGKFQVTQKQWEQVMGANPSRFRDCENCPVEQVSWNDVKNFIATINKTDTSYHYRLPSEAEWEYAARAGTVTAFACGDSLSSKQANFDGNYPYGGAAQGEYKEKTTPVGSYEPNPWGLYDMHGNVWEWCEDIYQDNYRELPGDGTANLTSGDTSFRVLRGGSRLSNGDRCRSATRYWSLPDIRSSYFGFRLVAVPLM